MAPFNQLQIPKLIVQQGYDKLGSRYRARYENTNPAWYIDWLTKLTQRLPSKAHVLEFCQSSQSLYFYHNILYFDSVCKQ